MSKKDEKPNRFLSTPASSSVPILPLAAKVSAEASGIPGAGAFTDALLSFVEAQKAKLQQRIQEENKQRVDEMYTRFLEGEGLSPQMAQAMLDDNDFHALLRACVTDIESEKTAAYAQMARSIATGTVEEKWRRHFILSLRDLCSDELAILRGAYVTVKYEVKPNGPNGTQLMPDSFLKVGQPGSTEYLFMRNLEAAGFVHEGKLTKLGSVFTVACWSGRELTPSAIGHEEWLPGFVHIIMNLGDDGKPFMRLQDELQKRLRMFRQRASCSGISRETLKLRLYRPSACALLFSGDKERIDEHREQFETLVGKIPTLLVNLSSSKLDVDSLSFRNSLDVEGLSTEDAVTRIANSIVAMQGDAAHRAEHHGPRRD